MFKHKFSSKSALNCDYKRKDRTTGAVAKPYIENFKQVGNIWVIRGTFQNTETQLVNGIYQARVDDLCADPFDWTNNGIYTKLLDDLDDMEGRSFEDGHTLKFKPENQRGDIVKYAPNVGEHGAVAVDFGDGNGLIWFDAKKLWEHE